MIVDIPSEKEKAIQAIQEISRNAILAIQQIMQSQNESVTESQTSDIKHSTFVESTRSNFGYRDISKQSTDDYYDSRFSDFPIASKQSPHSQPSQSAELKPRIEQVERPELFDPGLDRMTL